ncbi:MULTISPECIES: SDR family oxidoreductase [Caldisericum]|jgi:NAD(P)-dependent dehydrogenase (short-subunit alcohol dehydrogenase family)|uniref:Short-chain dehydrogenase n=2 Tax=Caldisericum exile TaxID=693075 RepID=A0A2J6WEB6_9BACT|nr:MAG: short-chain dehydrogenase [Caldisericum exile]
MDWDISTKKVLITGATSGIGKATLIDLAKSKAFVIFTARDKNKALTVLKEAKELSKNENIEFFEVDLSSFKSILDFLKRFKEKHNKLDILINNAGTWNMRLALTEDGIEKTFMVNYLAPFYITHSLLPLLSEGSPSRIINVSSAMHKGGKINLDDLESRNHYNGIQSYSNSKLMILMFTIELAKRLKDKGIYVFAVHPGLVKTGIFSNFPKPIRDLFLIGAKTPEEGAKTSIYLAKTKDIEYLTGNYFADSKPTDYLKIADNEDLRKKLWDKTTDYIKKYINDFEPLV